MNKVWIPRRSHHDFSDAEQWGITETLVPDSISPFQVDRVGEHIKLAISRVSEEDYVIPCGPPHYMVILTDLWPFPTMRLLIFHHKKKVYVDREVQLQCRLQARV